jgi:hypothetical protein
MHTRSSPWLPVTSLPVAPPEMRLEPCWYTTWASCFIWIQVQEKLRYTFTGAFDGDIRHSLVIRIHRQSRIFSNPNVWNATLLVFRISFSPYFFPVLFQTTTFEMQRFSSTWHYKTFHFPVLRLRFEKVQEKITGNEMLYNVMYLKNKKRCISNVAVWKSTGKKYGENEMFYNVMY